MPIFLPDNWANAPHFPGGMHFVAGILAGRLLLWGGVQRQKDGRQWLLPSDVVFAYDLDHHSFKDGGVGGSWSVMRPTGEIHPGRAGAANVVLDQTLYILGGTMGGEKYSAAFSTLTSSGDFRRLRRVGKVPSARSYSRAWSYRGNIFLLGGLVIQIDESRKNDFVECTKFPRYFYANDLWRCDPKTNACTRIFTNGSFFAPRDDYACSRQRCGFSRFFSYAIF